MSEASDLKVYNMAKAAAEDICHARRRLKTTARVTAHRVAHPRPGRTNECSKRKANHTPIRERPAKRGKGQAELGKEPAEPGEEKPVPSGPAAASPAAATTEAAGQSSNGGRRAEPLRRREAGASAAAPVAEPLRRDRLAPEMCAYFDFTTREGASVKHDGILLWSNGPLVQMNPQKEKTVP